MQNTTFQNHFNNCKAVVKGFKAFLSILLVTVSSKRYFTLFRSSHSISSLSFVNISTSRNLTTYNSDRGCRSDFSSKKLCLLLTMASLVRIANLRSTISTEIPVLTGLARHYSTTDEDKPSMFSRFFRRPKRQDEVDNEREQEDRYQEEERLVKMMEIEEQQAILHRKRNKSRLHYSDRQMLRGLPPNVGLSMQWCERHTKRNYKAQMLGRFGRTNTGLDPAMAWPTKEEMRRQAEYERVFYDGTSLLDRIAIHEDKVRAEREQMLAKYVIHFFVNFGKAIY